MILAKQIVPTELRRGNFVFSNTKNCVLKIVEVRVDRVIFEASPNNGITNISNLSGLPVTDEELERIGFKSTEPDIWEGQGISLKKLKDCYLIQNKEKKYNCSLLFFIHQLQNEYCLYSHKILKKKRELQIDYPDIIVQPIP